MDNAASSPEYSLDELQEFKAALETSGVHGALGYLNKRTPHRYTGIYRYDGDTLRSVAIYDRYEPDVQIGEDAPMAATYCSLLLKQQTLEITDAAEDERVKGVVITPVVSYCGVSIKDSKGNPFGSLCHFDMKRCQQRLSDFPLLEAAAEILYHHLYPEG